MCSPWAEFFFFFKEEKKKKSVPHHSLLELVRPGKRDLFGIIRPSSGKWKSDQQKGKLPVLRVMRDLQRACAVVIVTFVFLLVLFHFSLSRKGILISPI